MCKVIRRRDPNRPAFWYLSFAAPHPPMWPLQRYLDLYRDVPMDQPAMGAWSRDAQRLPFLLRVLRHKFAPQFDQIPGHELDLARKAFYAMCTHVDHQIRVVIGTLREAGLLGKTILAFVSDHGDMLGDHGLWAKTVMYEQSMRVPLLISLPGDDQRLGHGVTDDRLTDLVDVMPTLLDLAGLPIPASVEGQSLLSERRRDHLYGEHNEGPGATRMVRDARYKLIYYATGNVRQLFDLQADPRETQDLAGEPDAREHLDRLTDLLKSHLYGSDESWVRDGQLVGLPDDPSPVHADRGLQGQRGIRFL
jgi:arylsulfatase A-like enzyme